MQEKIPLGHLWCVNGHVSIRRHTYCVCISVTIVYNDVFCSSIE